METRQAVAAANSIPFWNAGCSRRHHLPLVDAALCPRCYTFEPGPRACFRCQMTPAPKAIVRDNQYRDCTGTAADLGPALSGNLTPGSPAIHLGRRLGILAQELKEELRQRDHRVAALECDTANQHPAGVGAALHVIGPGASEDGGGPPPRVLGYLGTGVGRVLATASLANTRSARRGWAATSQLRLPSADRLADGAAFTYFPHEEQRR